MSLTTVQQYQLLRIVAPDATVDNEDKFAFLGITEPNSYELTSAQKKQLLRVAVPDATVTTSDKFAFLGVMEALNPGGNIIEQFNVDWFIDPTLTGTLLPVSNDGQVIGLLASVTASFSGDNVPEPILTGREKPTLELVITEFRRYLSGTEISPRVDISLSGPQVSADISQQKQNTVIIGAGHSVSFSNLGRKTVIH